MIMYRGLGYLAVAVFAFAFFGAAFSFDALFGTSAMKGGPRWPLLVANLLAGALTWWLGRLLNREPLEVTVYESDGPRTLLETKHTLYAVRMEYWGPIFFALVLAILLTR